MVEQKAVQQFESECKKAKILVENDMPVGVFHDFLLDIKGKMVDLMVKNQKEEEAMSAKQKENEIVQDCCKSA